MDAGDAGYTIRGTDGDVLAADVGDACARAGWTVTRFGLVAEWVVGSEDDVGS